MFCDVIISLTVICPFFLLNMHRPWPDASFVPFYKLLFLHRRQFPISLLRFGEKAALRDENQTKCTCSLELFTQLREISFKETFYSAHSIPAATSPPCRIASLSIALWRKFPLILHSWRRNLAAVCVCFELSSWKCKFQRKRNLKFLWCFHSERHVNVFCAVHCARHV